MSFSPHSRPKTLQGKRLFDFIAGSILLIAAAPVMLIAVVAIKMSSTGPAVFVQSRVGYKQQEFKCYKLRTMVVNAPSVPTHFSNPNGITPLGKILRRTKIDELPQLWNVIKGEMSLVGPRPCLPIQSELINYRDELGVFSILPGITGLSQITGIDMSTPRLCAEKDAEYMQSWSWQLDLKLLLKTFIR